MNFKKRVNGSWTDTPNYIYTTSTDTITTLPSDIYADGNNATVGLVGNLVQTGTPTPDNPIQPQECGERTGNLFDGNFTVAVMSVSGNTATLNTASSGRTAIVECEPNTTYTVKKHSVSNRFIIAESDIKPVNGTAMSIIQNDSSISEYTFATSNTTQYVAIYCSTSSEQAEPQLMLNTGSTALPYEPYGIKIPISSAGQTTPVYLGEVQSTRKIKKYEFTGQETWYLYSAGNVHQFYTQNMVIGGVASSSAYSTIAPYGMTVDNRNGDYGCYTVSSGSEIAFQMYGSKADFPTQTDWKTYLTQQYANGTPVTVWYVLAEPTTGIVNEPIRKIGEYADTVSGITIPTIAGADSFDVQTTLKPSEVSANYHGWHTGTVHERESGSWD